MCKKLFAARHTFFIAAIPSPAIVGFHAAAVCRDMEFIYAILWFATTWRSATEE